MAMVGGGLYRCPRCGKAKPCTADNFYFARRTGYVTGFCRACQAGYEQQRWRAMSAYVRDRINARRRASRSA